MKVANEAKFEVRSLYEKIAEEYDSSEKLFITRLMEKCEANIVLKEIGKNHYKLLIDVGAGTGRYIKHLAKISDHVVPLDFSLNMLKVLKKKLYGISGRVDVVLADAEYMPFRSNVFDLALSTLTIDHIPNYINMLKETKRVLKRGGIFIFSSLNEAILDFYRRKHHIPKNRISFETEKIGKTHVYEKGHMINEMIKVLHNIKFKVKNVRGCCFWAFLGVFPWYPILLKIYPIFLDGKLWALKFLRKYAFIYIYITLKHI